MKKSETLFGVIGLALFGLVASKIGWGTLAQQLKAAWPAIPVLVTLSFLRLLLQTRSWTLALHAEGIETTLGELVGIRLASQSMGYLSVLGPAVSEPMKISLLRKNWDSSAAATLIDTGVYWFTSAFVGLAGCVFAASVLAGTHYAPYLFAGGTLFAISLALLIRQKAVFGRLVRIVGERAPVWLKKGAQLERQILSFRAQHPATLRSMAFMDLMCQGLVIAEAAVVLATLRVPLHIPLLLGIEAASRLVKMISGWVPARIGADEGGAAAAFAALGLAPSGGVVLALTRRFRDLLWCALGVGWLIWRSRPNRTREQEHSQGVLLTCKQS
jgi:hypothetical protein